MTYIKPLHWTESEFRLSASGITGEFWVDRITLRAYRDKIILGEYQSPEAATARCTAEHNRIVSDLIDEDEFYKLAANKIRSIGRAMGYSWAANKIATILTSRDRSRF